jgi:hypothetical protein
MTRNDFEIIAEALRAAKPSIQGAGLSDRLEGWRWTVVKVCDRLAGTNARFKRDTFMAAATGEKF